MILVSILFSALAFANGFTCDLLAYYPVDSGEKRSNVKIEIFSQNDELSGKVSIEHPNGLIEIAEDVKQKSLRYLPGINSRIDDALEKLNLDKVTSMQEFSFGPTTEQGVMALAYFLKGPKGEDLDQIVYVWGATGFGSCKSKKLIQAFF